MCQANRLRESPREITVYVQTRCSGLQSWSLDDIDALAKYFDFPNAFALLDKARGIQWNNREPAPTHTERTMFTTNCNQGSSKALRVRRILKDLSDDGLLEKWGLNTQTIYRMFGAKQDITVEPLSKIAQALQVSLARIIEDTEKIIEKQQ